MKIILNQDVYNLGEEGDVCVVTNGYARNFLIPQKMAVLFNRQSISMFESRKAAITKRKEEKRADSAGLKEKIEAITLDLKVSAGDSGKLFGSVSNATIAEELKKAGVVIERKKIEITGHTIKTLGDFIAKIKLYGNETADLKIIVKSDKKTEEVESMEKAD
ncbi:MAG: 50S ribosomal protein L9 [Spirochaetia bacterium]|jgi:large subunit ribosomal protein L9|nr:50S ribosomal protein L9 [Spirochaetia bacterium]